MKRTLLCLILFTCLCAYTVHSQTLQACRISAPDQITQLLPNYTGSIQPCSYSGFAPLDENANNALFYWYFPNQVNDPNAPVLLWLQGGPGASSMFGCLVEKLSPFSVVQNPNGGYNVIHNDEYEGHSWAYYYNVLFIDNPVGTGFSYTTDNSYPTNMDEVSADLWKGLQYFVSVHPETLNVDWHYTGESHAGRYIPSFAYYTLKFNGEINAGTRKDIAIPLKSILVGDGYVHGVQQRIVEIDVARASTMLAPYQVPQAKALIVNCQNLAATEGTTSLDAVDTCNSIPSYLGDVSGVDAYAIEINAQQTAFLSSLEDTYLNNEEVYKTLRVTGSKKSGPLFTDDDVKSTQALTPDILNNSIYFIEQVLEQIPCLYFAGNFDVRDGSYSYYKWFELLADPWNNILNQTRNIWYQNGEPVGFWMIYNNLTFVTLDNAGHFTPYFQIDVTKAMVQTFITDNNWDPYGNNTNVSSSMCNLMNNCNGNGQCLSSGVCQCNSGYFLEDCSVQPQAYDPSINPVVLQPRQFLYLQVKLTGTGQIISVQGQNISALDIYHSYIKIATYSDEASGYASANSNIGDQRKVFISSDSGFRSVYVTIQNSNYLYSANFTLNITQIDDTPTGGDGDDSESFGDVVPSLTVFISSLVILVVSAVLVAKRR